MKIDTNKKWDQLSPEVQEKLGDIFDTYTFRDALAEIYLHGFDQGHEDALNNVDYIG
jgi:hypothetical protein